MIKREAPTFMLLEAIHHRKHVGKVVEIDSSSKSQLAFAASHCANCDVAGCEPGSACRINRERGATQPERVADAACRHGAARCRNAIGALGMSRMSENIAPSCICPNADKHPHRVPTELLSTAPCIVHRTVRVLHDEALLHVHDLCLPKRDIEEDGVEKLRGGHKCTVLRHNAPLVVG